MRSFGDIRATRQAIFDRILKATSNLMPIENDRYSFTLTDPFYAEKDDPTPDQVKRAIIENGSVSKTLKGTWLLTDKQTGQTSQRPAVVAKVPYLLDNGTFLRNGTKFIMRNQSRLLPGAYVRQKENGEYEAHINADMREGAIHHYGLEPDTGVFNVLVSGSKTPIYGLARALGATDEEMEEAWGEDLTRINKKKFQVSQINKLYDKLARGKKTAVTDEEKVDAIRSSMEKINFDPEVMELTLGKPYKHMSKEVLLAATSKLLRISRGEDESDDRDNLAFNEVYGPEDIFEERLSKDTGSYRRQLFYNLVQRYGGNIEKIPAGALSRQVDSAILASGLGGNPEEVNALEVFDKAYSLTKIGQGALSSIDAAPDESRNVHPSQRGYIDPSRTPESLRVGIDTYLATASRKGADRQMYTPVLDKDGQQTYVRPKDLMRKTVAIGSEYRKAMDDDYIPVMQRGKEVLAKKSEVEYVLPNFEEAFSPLANLVPFKSGMQGNRVAMGSRFISQALPLVNGEAPYVQTGIPGKPGRSYYEEFGRDAGAIFADQPGRILEATDDHILIGNADGTKKTIPLARWMPGNRKTAISQSPVVTVGQQVQPGDILVRSNMTDDKGAIALGLNANVVMVPWKGMNFEDGILISESFAKRATSQHMYQSKLDLTDDYKMGKHSFMGIFPSTFNKRQLDQMDKDGVILPGTTVKKGDPLILAARSTEDSKKKGRRRLFSDSTLTWDHHDDGVVTDAYYSPKGATVLVRAEMPMRESDKLSNRFGSKGVVRILPDEEMPMTEDGMVAEVVISPGSTVSRGNPAMLAELALGKLAKITGQTYKVTDFEDIEDIPEYVNKELEKYGVSPDSPVIDQKTGKKIYNADGSGAANGSMWMMKLHHTAEGKISGRGLGGYSADGSPSKGNDTGAKRVSPSNLNALVSHGAYQTFMDAKYHRGQANEDYWLQYMKGFDPPVKKTPLVYEKFENSLKASGINVTPDGGRINVMAMTDKDVAALAGNREVKSGEMIRWEKDKQPIAGGLFDPTLFGMNGDRWGKMTPVVPILNPVMEDPARILLGLKQKELKAVLSGEQPYKHYGSGQSAIQAALGDIKVDKELARHRNIIQNGRASERDSSVRALGYLKSCEQMGMHPKEWMLSSLPILPPKFRPASEMKDSNVPLIDDANYLYKLMIDTNNALKELRTITKDTKAEEYGLYESYKQVTGLADPTHPKLVQRQVRGLLRGVFGVGSSKFSMVQRSLLGTTVDSVGRGVVVGDPDLDMDSVGLPEDRTWDVYRPYVMHRLTKRGIPWAHAAGMIEDRKEIAREALVAEMEERPVIMDRAPVLHKGSMLAFKPRLVAGDSVRMNQFVQKSTNMDFDGNCCDYDTEIILSLSESVINSSPLGRKWFTQWRKDMAMISDGTSVWAKSEKTGDSIARVRIGFLTRVGTPIKDKNGADVYALPDGISVLSYVPGVGAEMCPVTSYTVETNCPCVEVETDSGRRVTVSDNESLCAFNPDTGQLVKIAPKDAIGKFAPVVREIPNCVVGKVGDRELGWWYGSLVSDGWQSPRMIGYAKLEKVKRDEFERIARKYIHENFRRYNYPGSKGEKGKLGDSMKIHLNGADLAGRVLTCTKKGGGRAALRKFIPRQLLDGSREMLLGLLAGLIDGDGSLAVNTVMKNPRMAVCISTSSKYLVNSAKELLRRLGCRYSVTVYPPRGHSNTAYTIHPSVCDFYKLLPELSFVGAREQKMRQTFLSMSKPVDKQDPIPVAISLAKVLRQYVGSSKKNGTKEQSQVYSSLCGAVKKGYLSRDSARKVLQYYDYPESDSLKELAARVHDKSIIWEKIEKVTEAGNRDVYDLAVPATKIFAVNDGLVIFDTCNFHVPKSKDAVKEAFELLMPSKSLIKASDMKSAMPQMISESAGGLYLASLPPDKKQRSRTFMTWKDVQHAYDRGEIAMDDPVVVLS